jgi:divalent metal cation (Fe/Co/Zn/Cd) transporter
MSDRPSRSQVQSGVYVEWFSSAWMVLEAALAIGAGVAAHSLLLVAFGADSVIELVSSAILLWRLSVEAHGAAGGEVARAEKTASFVVGAALIALALYIIADSAHSLLTHSRAEVSFLGIGIAAASSVVMPFLARAKRRIGCRISSRALEADGSCSMVCAYMSWIVLAGVLANWLFGWWWLDSIAALGLVYFVSHEGIESIQEARE